MFCGYWAIYRHKIFREDTSKPQIDIDYESVPYGKNKLIKMNMTIKNIGKTWVRPIESGIKLSVKQLPENKDVGSLLHWNDGTDLLDRIDVIHIANPDKDYDVSVYRLEPGDEYRELLSLVVPSVVLVMARLEYRGSEDDHVWVYRIWRV